MLPAGFAFGMEALLHRVTQEPKLTETPLVVSTPSITHNNPSAAEEESNICIYVLGMMPITSAQSGNVVPNNCKRNRAVQSSHVLQEERKTK